MKYFEYYSTDAEKHTKKELIQSFAEYWGFEIDKAITANIMAGFIYRGDKFYFRCTASFQTGKLRGQVSHSRGASWITVFDTTIRQMNKDDNHNLVEADPENLLQFLSYHTLNAVVVLNSKYISKAILADRTIFKEFAGDGNVVDMKDIAHDIQKSYKLIHLFLTRGVKHLLNIEMLPVEELKSRGITPQSVDTFKKFDL
jgi:hypothetical protein